MRSVADYAAEAAEASSAAHIVLAEADPELRRLLATALRGDGHEVVVARDADELVEHLGTLCLKREVPELIIANGQLPGTACVFESLVDRGWPSMPMIVLNAESSLDGVETFDVPGELDGLRTTVQALVGAQP